MALLNMFLSHDSLDFVSLTMLAQLIYNNDICNHRHHHYFILPFVRITRFSIGVELKIRMLIRSKLAAIAISELHNNVSKVW